MIVNYLKSLIEHFFVLPVKWYRLHYVAWRNLQQKCKVCGCRDKFNFHVTDDIWQRVIPSTYQNRVVCLACFDDFAKKKEVDYSTSLTTIYFSGSNFSFQLNVHPDTD